MAEGPRRRIASRWSSLAYPMLCASRTGASRVPLAHHSVPRDLATMDAAAIETDSASPLTIAR
jgi:hypothetical protein